MKKVDLKNGFSLIPFTSDGSAAIGAKRTTGMDVNALVYTRYNADGNLELVLNADVLRKIGATVVVENFDKSLPERTERDTSIIGIIDEYGPGDYGLWEGFSLTDAEEHVVLDILNKHDTEGCSIRGSREDVANEFK